MILIKNTKTSKIQKRVIPYTGTKTHINEDVIFDNINECCFFGLKDHCLRLYFNKSVIRIIEFFLKKSALIMSTKQGDRKYSMRHKIIDYGLN